MARALLYLLIAGLGLFVLSAVFVLEHGGGTIGAPNLISIHDLSVTPQAYAGEHVTTEGVLRRIVEPEEHFVVTADGLAIVVSDYNVEALRELDGVKVRVEGRFGFADVDGVLIEAELVTPLP